MNILNFVNSYSQIIYATVPKSNFERKKNDPFEKVLVGSKRKKNCVYITYIQYMFNVYTYIYAKRIRLYVEYVNQLNTHKSYRWNSSFSHIEKNLYGLTSKFKFLLWFNYKQLLFFLHFFFVVYKMCTIKSQLVSFFCCKLAKIRIDDN